MEHKERDVVNQAFSTTGSGGKVASDQHDGGGAATHSQAHAGVSPMSAPQDSVSSGVVVLSRVTDLDVDDDAGIHAVAEIYAEDSSTSGGPNGARPRQPTHTSPNNSQAAAKNHLDMPAPSKASKQHASTKDRGQFGSGALLLPHARWH
jgi:hypothetical protein